MERWGRGLRLFAALVTVSGLLSTATPAGAAVVTRKLTVQKVTGASYGQGTVTSTATGATTTAITCDPTCTSQVKPYVRYSDITITVAPDKDSTISSITTTSGSTCVRNGDTCRIGSLSSDTIVTVTFTRTPQLSVTKTGGGGGTITAAGLAGYAPMFRDCGTTTPCTSKERLNAGVTLTATADTASEFVGWSGATGCSGPSCTVTMSTGQAVTATFRPTYPLSASTASLGSGSGSLTLNDATCGKTCIGRFMATSSVALTARADAGSVFTGWAGVSECMEQAACTPFAMGTADRTGIVATFASLEQLALDVGGAVGASVTSSDGVFDCAAACAATYPYGTEVTLSANPQSDAEFTGWTGAGGCDTDPICTVTVVGAGQRIGAVFGGKAELLVDRDLIGDAGGTIVVSERTVTPAEAPGGAPTIELTAIDCDPACWLHPGTQVVVEASPAPGSRWDGWAGPCLETDATSLTCTVTLDDDTTIAARFVEVHTLSVEVVGTGGFGGAVAGIGPSGTCATGATCSATFDAGTTVTLTPTAADATTTSFAWSGTGLGACAADVATCTFRSDATVTVTFAEIVFPLAIDLAGDGSGAVSVATIPNGNPVRSPCVADCSLDVPLGDSVLLTAAWDPGAARFAGWSGDCDTTTATTCTVTADAALDVTATFVRTSLLTVTVVSSGGTGKVTLPAGVGPTSDCVSGVGDVVCSVAYDAASTITLTAAPTTTSGAESMVSWTGCDTSTATSCTVAMDAAARVGATFVRQTYVLDVGRTLLGTGAGTVRSDVGGIVCPTSTCSGTYVVGTAVTLTAQPATGSAFTGWSAPCTSAGTGSCVVTMDAARMVTATFASLETLTVVKGGLGSGTVESADSRIVCGTTCSAGEYPWGTTIVLTATPASPSVIGGWGAGLNGCKKAPTCSVTLNGSLTVRPTFDPPSWTLTLRKSGSGTGTITASSDTTTVTCGTSCSSTSGSFFANRTVTITASPSSTSYFEAWDGACASFGSSPTCTLSEVSVATDVTARFSLPTLTITKQRWATGNGTIVASIPNSSKKVTCGTACTTISATYAPTTVVTLTATPVAGSAFSGWGGACEFRGLLTTCSITMDAAAKPVVANFGTPVPIGVSILSAAGSVTVATQFGEIGTCAASCQYSVTAGVDVTFTPVPTASTAFDGWDGDDRCAILGTVSPCVIRRIVATASVLVLFRPLP